MLLIVLAHPVLIFYPFKDGRHELLKLLIIRDFVLILSINKSHQVVEHHHDEVVVVATIPVFENNV